MTVYNTYPAVNEEYSFPSVVNQGIASSPEVQAMVSNKITTEVSTLVAAEIADDNTVVVAAANAVSGVLGGRLEDLEATVLHGVDHTLSITHGLYSRVELSYDFRIIGGTLITGGKFSSSSEKIESAVLTGEGVVELTYDYRRRQPGSEANGLTAQTTVDEWFTRATAFKLGMTALLSVGDSMTMDYGGLGTSVADELSRELGVTSYNQGYSGDTPYQLAWRMGVSEVRATVPGGTIPASGSVSVNITPNIGWYRARVFDAVITDIKGVTRSVTINQAASAAPSSPSTWTIELKDSLGEARILDGTRVVPTTGLDSISMTSPLALWIGRNDVNLNRVVESVNAFLVNHRDPLRRRIIRPIFNSSGEPRGSTGYNNVMAVNEGIRSASGLDYYDDRSVLIKHGLEIMNITPTESDITAMSEDRIPTSLMLDGTHLNVNGRKALARIDAIEIKVRNWF